MQNFVLKTPTEGKFKAKILNFEHPSSPLSEVCNFVRRLAYAYFLTRCYYFSEEEN